MAILPFRTALLAFALILPTASPAATPAAGLYRGDAGHEVAAELLLGEDGTYYYALSVGALDEESRGRWEEHDGVITLITDPKPVPPRFALLTDPNEPVRTMQDPPPYLLVTMPNGRGVPGIDFIVHCADGTTISDYTQVDGWGTVDEGPGCDNPQWVELHEAIHDIHSEPIVIPAGTKSLHFRLIPNDVGLVDLTSAIASIEGDSLLLMQERGLLRFRRVAAAETPEKPPE